MGEEIGNLDFSAEDFRNFKKKLHAETRLLLRRFRSRQFERTKGRYGFELEGWLVDKEGKPLPKNRLFLSKVNNSHFVPELSKYNFEINSDPEDVHPLLLERLQHQIQTLWSHADQTAQKMNAHPVMIGILPTLEKEVLTLKYMSQVRRYFALTQRIMKHRWGKPLHVQIEGPEENLDITHRDIMLEAATTSLQIHIQINQRNGVRFYNASKIASGPMAAVAANSPYFYGKQLWDETRIPLFEQAVALPNPEGSTRRQPVTYGLGYAKRSLLEPFLENLEGYPVLLPQCQDTDPHLLKHLRLQNGTVWRWNRAIVGLDDGAKRAHLRIEHRVPPSGPTPTDIIANIAFFLGLVYQLANDDTPPEELMDFAIVKSNFYQAARYGLDSTAKWVDGETYPMVQLISEVLIPKARSGLEKLQIDRSQADYYLGDIILNRVTRKQNGANWQKRFIEKNGKDFKALTLAYLENQRGGLPVHAWKL